MYTDIYLLDSMFQVNTEVGKAYQNTVKVAAVRQ